MSKRTILLLVGFFLFASSVIGFILNLVGVSLIIYKPIEALGMMTSVIIKLILLSTGLILVYYVKTVKK